MPDYVVTVEEVVVFGTSLSPDASGGDGRWQDVISELRNFGDTTPGRLLAEAAISEAAIANGELPPQC